MNWTNKVNAKQTFLSHMTAIIDYDTEYSKLSAKNVYPAYDGLKISL
jgi:uncharacterized protein YvpB